MSTLTIHPDALQDAAAGRAYDAMTHNPYRFDVIASYRALEETILTQWADVSSRLEVEWHYGDGDYPDSAAMFADMAVGRLRTRRSEHDGLPFDHPMARVVPGGYILNDVFRAVHDVYGHGAARSGFGPLGELAAWLEHRRTMPDAALPALWCETRGQAAWMNGLHADKPLPARPFPAQKSGMPPAWVV